MLVQWRRRSMFRASSTTMQDTNLLALDPMWKRFPRVLELDFRAALPFFEPTLPRSLEHWQPSWLGPVWLAALEGGLATRVACFGLYKRWRSARRLVRYEWASKQTLELESEVIVQHNEMRGLARSTRNMGTKQWIDSTQRFQWIEPILFNQSINQSIRYRLWYSWN